jgi:hypothetical protein
MSDLLEFLAAVFWRWQGWAGGGGVGGAVVVIVGIYDRVSGDSLSKQMYIAIFLGAFLLGAFYLAWRDEHQKVSVAQASINDLHAQLADLKNPDFRIEIQGNSVGLIEQRPDLSAVTLFVSITNVGAPSVARDWRLAVKRPGIDEPIVAKSIVPPTRGDVTLGRENDSPLIIAASEELAAKTAQMPLTRGEARVGYLLYAIEGVPGAILRAEQTRLTLTVSDVHGRRYSAESLRSGKPGLPAPYVPGLPMR